MTKMMSFKIASVSLVALALGACASTGAPQAAAPPAAPAQTAPMMQHTAEAFEADRQAILAMQGEYEVTFDFTEFLPVGADYELKDPKVTPAREVVYVIEDTGEYIALQHLLLTGDEEDAFVVKHWRQDWQYQPERLLAFQGFNTFHMEEISPEDRAGAWSQTVYQVDDSPRYAGLARWEHAEEASTWEPARSYRPLPRRDATTRDDYDAISAVNRHTILSWGWTHEQDNSKVVLRDEAPQELVREHGINTYRRADLVNDQATADYWDATHEYWADIRAIWTHAMNTADVIVAEDDADGTLLYSPVLNEGYAMVFDDKSAEDALAAAIEVIEAQVTLDGAALEVE